MSPPLIQALAVGGITLVLLDRAGYSQARVEGPVSGNVLLRWAQSCLRGARRDRSFVSANQRAMLQRALRDYDEGAPPDQRAQIEAVVERLGLILRRVAYLNEGVEALRGGEAAQYYFAVFDHLIRAADPAIRFRGRSRRPPLNPVNVTR